MTLAPDGRTLVGQAVRLDATVPADADALFAALDHDPVWAAGYGVGTPRPTTPDELRAGFMPESGRTQYTVRRIADGEVLGTSSIGDVDVTNEQCHLGWTAYAPAVWGTGVNAECKLLLLGHCFDDLGMGRVRIQTDDRNARSQAAIAALGATREGVLRRDRRRADGTFRDTVVFSILADEWPRVRAALEQRLTR